MRRIELKVIEIEDVLGRPTLLNYAETFIQLAKTSNEGGLTGEQMTVPLAIVTALEAARDNQAETVLLEEAEWSYLAGRAKNNRWPFASSAFQQLISDLAEAPKVDLNADHRREVN